MALKLSVTVYKLLVKYNKKCGAFNLPLLFHLLGVFVLPEMPVLFQKFQKEATFHSKEICMICMVPKYGQVLIGMVGKLGR